MRYLTLSFFLTLLSLTAYGQRLDKSEKRILKEKGIYDYFLLPEGKNNGKSQVTFSQEIKAQGIDKARLYKRAQLFVAQQNWGNTEHIRCKDGVTLSSQLVDKEILFADEEEGIITGQGYSFFPMGRAKHFFLTFRYKITVADGAYSYRFDNFEILEFVRGPMSKGKATGVAYAGIASGGSRTRFYDVDLRSYPVEEFFSVRIIKDGYHGDLT
ncbi:MAG TPA: DUF4468 domain-containing protein, partial [Flavipsychrobacter sp.]